MDELTSLPGVARKTANIILSNAFGIDEGIAVDTHVKRVSYRLGLTKNEDPVKIEQDLIAITPKGEWRRYFTSPDIPRTKGLPGKKTEASANASSTISALQERYNKKLNQFCLKCP